MAEAVGLAASIAGLVQLTGSVFKVVTKFCKEAKDAPSKAQELATQTRELAGLLENLRLLASSLETRDPDYALKPEHLDTCGETLDIIQSKLEKAQRDFESSKPTKTFSRRLKWPFSLSDTKDLVADLANHRATLHLALSADSMDVLLKSLAKQDELHTMIERKLSFDTRVQLNARRKEVIDFFLRVNPQDYLETSRDLRYKATGTWLTEGDATFKTWKDGSNSKVWLSGIPGSGKTVLCGLVIETVLQDSDESTAVCYAFCDYKNPDTHLPENIVAALAVQLGQQSEDAFDLLEEFYDGLHPEEKLPTQPRLDDLLHLVQCMADVYDKVFVAVDGLDECGDHVLRMTESLKCLADRSGAISAALFSRKEEDIRDELEESFEHIEVEAHTKDLQDYAIAEMNKRKVLKKLQATNPVLHQEILSTLVRGARGMFRWVACQIDHICDQPNNKARKKALSELPPTLFGTYDRVLDKLRKSPPQTQTCIQKALHWIALGEPRIEIPALCEAVSIQDGADTIDEDELIHETEISRWCGCLIRKSWDGEYFEFAHFTVLEYLQSTSSQSRVGEFRYSEQDAFGLLAETAIRYLLIPCFDRKPTLSLAVERVDYMERNRKYPFYHHAAILFPSTSVSGKSRDLTRSQVFAKEPILSLLKQLFNPDNPGSLSTWTQQMMLSDGDDKTIQDLDVSPLHIAARFGQPELCEYVIQQGANVNASFKLGTPLDVVIFAVKEMHQTTVSPQLESHASPGAGRWARTLGILLDHGADASMCLSGRSSLSEAFSVLNGFDLLPFVRPSTAVPDDAIEAFYDRSHNHEGDQQLLEAILEIATRDDGSAPSRWQPMVAPALIHRQARGPVDIEHATNDLSNHYSNADYPKALRVATQRGLLGELLALVMDPRFVADGCSLLHVVAESSSSNGGHIASVLLNAGLDLHGVDSKSQTCLHVSCQSDNVEVAQVLLDKGADISCKSSEGQTAWHIAASKGHTRILKMLHERDHNVFQSLLTICANARTPLSSAIGSGHVEASLLILEWCPADTKFFESKNPLLQDAAATGSQELFSALLAKGVDWRTDVPASTPMHYLEASCTAEFVRYLETMYDPLQPDALSRYPFQRFLQRWICHNAEVDADEITPLSGELLHLLLPTNLEFIVETPHTRSVHVWEIVCEVIGPEELCCFAGGDPDDSPDGCEEYFSRDLHTLIEHGIIASYEKSVERPSIEPLIKAWLKGDAEHFCSTAIASTISVVMEASIYESMANLVDGIYELLNMAIRKDSSAVASKLIYYGADVHQLTAENSDPKPARSSFEAACSQADPDTFRVFLGAAKSSFLNMPGSTGDTPIDLVVKGSRSSIDKTSFIRALCDKGASPKTANTTEPAILHAAWTEEWDVVECLANLGGNLFVKNKSGWGLAHFAASQGKLNMFKWVVASSSDPSQWQTSCEFRFNTKKLIAGQRSFADVEVSLLHLGANNRQMAQYLLEKGLFDDVNVPTGSRKTPLHYAAFRGQSSCCQLFLDHSAVVDVPDGNDKLPIEYALDSGNEDTVDVLIQAGSPLPGAKIGGVQDATWRLSKDEKLSTVRQLYFEKAILAGNLEQCKNAVDQGCSLDRPMPSCQRCTPLFTAVRARKANIVTWLLEQGATTLGVFCHHNTFPGIAEHASVHLDSLHCMYQVLRAALGHGDCWDLGLTTPIYLAVKNNKMQGLRATISHVTDNVAEYRKILESHFDWTGPKNSEDLLVSTLVNMPDNSGNGYRNTPLHCAASVGDLSALNLLLQHGADVFAIDGNQDTALTVAARNGHLSVVKALIIRDAEIECKNASGYTAMALAVGRGHLDVVKLLDSASRFALAYTTVSGKNLASLAAIHGSPVAIFRYLVSRGVNPQHYDRDGYCALNLARSNGELMNYLIQSRLAEPPRVPVLQEPKSPFVRPAAENQTGLIKRLYLTLPPMQARTLIDRDGWSRGSALCEAAAANRVEAAEVLLAFQANIEQDGSCFGTPLMCAIACGKLDMTKLLLRRGAKLEYTDKDGSYRSGLLLSLPHPEITRWLLAGRFQDQKRLANDAFNSEAASRPWSGKRVVGVALKSWQQRRREESTFGFCVRLQQMRKRFLGKVVAGELV